MPLLTRQLFNTGITRVKEQVSVVASESVLVAGVKATRIDHLLKNAQKVGGDIFKSIHQLK